MNVNPKSKSKSKPLIITEEDFNLLKQYASRAGEARDNMSLAHELERAKVVSKQDCPKDVVRLNSKVSVLDLETNKILEITIVLPGSADIRTNKISLLTPMGTALIGCRMADEIQWRMPAGLKRLRILNVSNKE